MRVCVCGMLEGDQCHGKNSGCVWEIRSTCVGRGGCNSKWGLRAVGTRSCNFSSSQLLSSGSWWWTGKPGVLLSMGSQRVRHDWAAELNWTEQLLKKVGELATWPSGASPSGRGTPGMVLPRESHPACPGPHGDRLGRSTLLAPERAIKGRGLSICLFSQGHASG